MPLLSSEVPPSIATEFRAPLDFLKNDSAPLPQLYDWHAKENPNYPLFTFQDGEKTEYITYSGANRAIDRAARYILSGLPSQHSATQSGAAKPPVVAIFAKADSIPYFCTAVGVLRAGCTAFLVSTRNGAAAIADMLLRTGATQVFVSRDGTTLDVARDALGRLPGGQVELRNMPVYEDLFPTAIGTGDSVFDKEVVFPRVHDVNAVAAILHSSGSTSFPKTISWTHKRLLFIGREPLTGGAQMAGTIWGAHAVPMFHAMGAFMIAVAPICGSVLATFKPATPPVFPTPSAVWQGIVASKSDISFGVPAFIEEWARDPAKVAYLKQMQRITFGGAPLNQEIGDALASQGVQLGSAYGLTEVGNINSFTRVTTADDWSYFQPSPSLSLEFRPHGDGKFEIVVLSPPENPLPAVNTKVSGQDAYATNDLVEPHPTKPNLWRIYGRADEQIMLSNGEKTNPLPLETTINEDPHVKHSVMFGRGKFQNGILVEPADAFKFDPRDTKALEAFRNRIWPSVERANANAPQHSRIFKEMILVASPSKPFELNVKGMPRRGVVIEKYSEEIEALYKQVEDSSQSDVRAPSVWDENITLLFVRGVVERTLRRDVEDNDDIFRNGCDSLQSTYIRNTIIRAIRETDTKAAARVPTNLVYQAPTIASLAQTVRNIVKGSGIADAPPRTPQDLWKYVEKYSSDFPARPSVLVDRPESAKDVVLITGTTGGFGCDALEHLLRDESVERVYAFNRKGSNALERQHAQFRARGLDESLLESPKFKIVEAVLHEPGFGVEPELLDEVRRSVTHIMLNAWTVNFSLALSSFELDIKGARNFIDLAISSPYTNAPTVVFVSSISVFNNYSGPAPAPEASLDDPTSAFGTGYSEGKWVTEHILQKAQEQRGVHAVVMRLGQVAGNRVGYWNEKEWFPALVKSAQFQRCLPDIEGNVAWIPGYEAAKAFTEMRHSPHRFLHLVHPQPAPWHDLIAPIAEALGVPLVPYKEWQSSLQNSVSEGDVAEVELMRKNPALRLLSMFKGARAASADREPLGLVYLSTEKAAAVSKALATLPQLDAERAKGWVAAWKGAGFL